MQRRLISVILFALIAAFVSSTLLYKVISANSGKPPSSVKVLVAAKDLEAGAVITESDVSEMPWASGAAPQGIRKRDDIVGRVLVAAINKNEPIADNRLAPKGSSGGIASRIPPGMRAVAVHIDELSGLSRLLMSGMRVDVLSTGMSPRKGDPDNPGMVTRTILQNIEVLSTGQTVDKNSKAPATSAQSADLLVTPEQAEILSEAVAQNRIQLALRNPLDASRVTQSILPNTPETRHTTKPHTATPAAPVRVAAAPIVAAAPAKPAGPTVEIIHGTKKVVALVDPAENPEANQ